ncbi:hypothetical protein FXO37_19695 [Capsicum annuum]|nr:hypothetical protein FXO37_19695 [Capsicum annuum]
MFFCYHGMVLVTMENYRFIAKIEFLSQLLNCGHPNLDTVLCPRDAFVLESQLGVLLPTCTYDVVIVMPYKLIVSRDLMCLAFTVYLGSRHRIRDTWPNGRYRNRNLVTAYAGVASKLPPNSTLRIRIKFRSSSDWCGVDASKWLMSRDSDMVLEGPMHSFSVLCPCDAFMLESRSGVLSTCTYNVVIMMPYKLLVSRDHLPLATTSELEVVLHLNGTTVGLYLDVNHDLVDKWLGDINLHVFLAAVGLVFGSFNDIKATSKEKKRSLERQFEETNADGFAVTDLVHLENELQTALIQIRSTKVFLQSSVPCPIGIASF